jgi:hypothetical protein
VGYQDGSSLYGAVFVPNGIDPTGTVKISCTCKSSGWGGTETTVMVNCNGLASTCCNNACWGGSFWTGNWKIGPGHDAYDDAELELLMAELEIFVCCVTMPGGVGASGTRLCSRATGQILKTRRGHYILKYIWNGKEHYAHMPGYHVIGDNVCGKGVKQYLEEVVFRSWGFPLRYPEKISDAKCVKNCFWTVVNAVCHGL